MTGGGGNFLSDIASTLGMSKLQQALQSNNPANVIQSIAREYPESVRRVDLNGMLPLHYAADRNASVDVVQVLIEEYREGLEVHDCYGWTPLHYASRKNKSEEVVRALVKACPRTMFAKDTSRRLPVDVCRQRKSPIVAYLRKAMADYEKMPVLAPVVPTPAYVVPQQQPHHLPAIENVPAEIDLDDLVPYVPPFSASLDAPAPTAYQRDRDRVRNAVEHVTHEPALVSVAYVESIKTQTFLGDGFFGTVYKGTDPILRREFAIKSINTEILRGGTHQELEDAMKTFRTEQEVRKGSSTYG
jgi:Ankyrin repeats (3 copies)